MFSTLPRTRRTDFTIGINCYFNNPFLLHKLIWYRPNTPEAIYSLCTFFEFRFTFNIFHRVYKWWHSYVNLLCFKIFLPISFNVCFGCSKGPSHWDDSFGYTQHIFWSNNKKLNVFVCTLTEGLNVVLLTQNPERPPLLGFFNSKKDLKNN